MGRTQPAIMAERQHEVAEMLIQGKQTRHIVTFMHSKYNVSKVTVERDITEAYKWIKSYIVRNVDDVMALHISRYENIYDKATEAYDYRSAIQALQAMEKLLKMHDQQPLVTVNNNTLNIDGLNVQQIKEILHGDTRQQEDNKS